MYIQRVLGPVIQTVLEIDRNMELNPMTIYIKMINEAEIRTGEKTKLDRQVTPEQVVILMVDDNDLGLGVFITNWLQRFKH